MELAWSSNGWFWLGWDVNEIIIVIQEFAQKSKWCNKYYKTLQNFETASVIKKVRE